MQQPTTLAGQQQQHSTPHSTPLVQQVEARRQYTPQHLIRVAQQADPQRRHLTPSLQRPVELVEPRRLYLILFFLQVREPVDLQPQLSTHFTIPVRQQQHHLSLTLIQT